MKIENHLKRQIEKTKTKIKEKVSKIGLYENLGQDEVRTLQDKFIDFSDYSRRMNYMRSMLESFEEWCMNYNGD